MELIRSKSLYFDKYNTLKRPQSYAKKSDQLLLDKLRFDNMQVKRHLMDLEDKLTNSRETSIIKKYYDNRYNSRAPVSTLNRRQSSRIKSTKPGVYLIF